MDNFSTLHLVVLVGSEAVNGSIGFHIPTRRRRGLATCQDIPEIYPDVMVRSALPRHERGLVRGWLRLAMFRLRSSWLFKLLRSYFFRKTKKYQSGMTDP